MTLEALYKDVYESLTGHVALTALLGGPKVYDFEPEEPDEVEGPYIVIGDTHEVEGRTMDDGERKVFVRLYIWSSYRGRKEVIEIEREIEAALDGDRYYYESFQVLPSDEGWRHGVVIFRTFIERNDT